MQCWRLDVSQQAWRLLCVGGGGGGDGRRRTEGAHHVQLHSDRREGVGAQVAAFLGNDDMARCTYTHNMDRTTSIGAEVRCLLPTVLKCEV